MDADEEELKRIADEAGMTVEDLKHLAERLNGSAVSLTDKIAKAGGDSGTIACQLCGGDADFHRNGSSYTVKCDCGMGAIGHMPENMIPHTRH